jgi:predicted Zn-dependent protease
MSRYRAAVPDLLTQAQCQTLVARIFDMLDEPAARLAVRSMVTERTRFARGDAHVATSDGAIRVELVVRSADTGGKTGVLVTNRLDDAALTSLVRSVERAAREFPREPDRWPMQGPMQQPQPPKTFFENVSQAMAVDAGATVFRTATDATEAAGTIAAGDLDFELTARAMATTSGLFLYSRGSYGEFSLTARTPDGKGSGWSWQGAEDWSRVSTGEVIARAVDLAERSRNPVAIEPGRYTVILEPCAVASLLGGIDWRARPADRGSTAFSKDPIGTNKIGLQMLDSRLWISMDPWDPDMPRDLFNPFGDPVRGKVVLFQRGVLENLEYDSEYAKEKGRETVALGGGLRMYAEGPTQTLQEMIASTQRGVWVNRLSHVVVMNERTQLLTGSTRDGTFLIENGKITKAIKNFRFTESPFFVLNKLEAAGEPIRASRGMVAPRLKVRDFDFTSLTDAI